jgi:putative ABC transport system permease protein
MGLGVTLGVATLIAGQSLSKGAGEQVSQSMRKMFGPGTILVISPTMSEQDLLTLEEEVPEITALSPRHGNGELSISHEGNTHRSAVFGHTEQGEFVWGRGVVSGRFLSRRDVDSSARVALIGHQLAARLFIDEDPVGQDILIASVPFEVVGVLESIGIDPHGEDRDEDVFIPLSTSMNRLDNAEYFAWTKLKVGNEDEVEDAAGQIKEILRRRHHVAEGEKDDFSIYTAALAARMVLQANRTLDIYVMIAAAVVLLVAAAVIASIMLVSLRQRLPEIGLRKAVGASEQSIGWQFMAEAVVISLFSGVAGVGLGLAVAGLFSARLDIPLAVTASGLSLGLLAAAAVGLVAGVWPARKAAALDPVLALA